MDTENRMKRLKLTSVYHIKEATVVHNSPFT